MKLSPAQTELMKFLRDGCRVRICYDSRICGVRVFRPGQFCYLAAEIEGKRCEARLTWRTVVKLLTLGLIEIVSKDEQCVTYQLKAAN